MPERISKMKLNLRYIAQFIIEADTALNLSSGERDLLTDSLVKTDANGLPMIPGASLTGVLRHSFAEEGDSQIIDNIFGCQGITSSEENDGRGSRLVITDGLFIGSDGNVIEGLKNIDWDDSFYAKFRELPIRDHCKITEKGTAADHGKFDNQIVYKGTRFKFEMELTGTEKDAGNWKSLLELLSLRTFRLGGGTRKGYGKIKVISAETKKFNLDISEELNAYLEKTSELAIPLAGGTKIIYPLESDTKRWINYKLELVPEDFFSFGSGFGDEDADMTPVYEDVLEWDNNQEPEQPYFSVKKVLIPASSVKGAVSHRVAFHFNNYEKIFADEIINIDNYVGEKNPAVKALFGYKKDSKHEDEENKSGQRGNVLFSDVYLENEQTEKILNHVAIDRFTGGAMDGALFDEKVITQKDTIIMELYVHKRAFETENVKQAFESTLDDITTGLLPLGSRTMGGHGCFNGKWEVQ